MQTLTRQIRHWLLNSETEGYRSPPQKQNPNPTFGLGLALLPEDLTFHALSWGRVKSNHHLPNFRHRFHGKFRYFENNSKIIGFYHCGANR